MGYAPILCKSNTGTLAPFQYRAGVTSTNIILFGFQNSPNVNTDFPSNSCALNSNWQYISITYDGLEIKYYLNGVFVSSVNYIGQIFPDNKPLEIGRDAHGPIEYFDGDIDDLKIYNTALNSAEIYTLYSNQSVCSNIITDTCKTTQISLNIGVDANGNLLSIGAQDMNWEVTSILNTSAQMGFNVPFNPFVITPHNVWFPPINSRWLNITTSYNENAGPLNTLVEMTRHFTTIQDDTFKLKVIFTVDNYVAYFKIDGVIYYTSSAGSTLTSIQTTAINDSIIFIPIGCHDITVGYVNYYNGGTGSNPTGINIEGYIQSVTGDSSILKQDCVTNTPPTLNATDTLNYCANCEYISPNLSITSGLGCGNLDTVKVYFTSGYTQGQDTLQFVPLLGINSTFNASTGVLTLFGNANYGVWETVLQTVCYKSLVANISNANVVKNVVISLGNALYNPANGNFYKLVNNGNNINWTDAKNAASSSSYFGLHGYLVTVTSAQENNFLVSLIQSLSWLGASDSAQESIWRWVTGCEGLEDNGQGRHFSNQQGNCGSVLGSGLSVNSNFVNWYNSEPNDNGCDEDYAHFLTNPLGMWNDYPNSSTLVNVPSYIVEYGCMPGDPLVNITGNVTINLLSTSDTVINHTICQGDTFLNHYTSGTWTDTFITLNGCDSLRTLILTVNPLPNVNSTPAIATVCAGQSTILSGTGATSYAWSGGINDGGPFIPASTTTYTVTGTDANGCSNTNTKLVTVNALPNVNSTSTPLNGIVCAGNSVTLTGTGASTYIWSGGVNNGVSFVPLSTATYTVTGTDANGCSNTNIKLITVNPLPTISINSIPNPPTICIGASISLTANGANTYAWSGGISNGISFNPVVSTTYTVTGTDVNNCSNTNSIAVTVNPLPNVNSTPPLATLCFGQSMTLNGTGASTYTWSGGVINNSPFTINNSTTYTVTGTDANGCSNTNTKLVTVNALPTLSISPTNPSICLNQNVNLTANGANSYSWSPGLGLNQTTGATVNAGPTVTTTYTVTGTDVNGCNNTISNSVNVNALPILITAPSSATICQLDSIVLTVSGANTFSWSPSAGLNTVSGNTVKASPNASTTYTITGTNANGCTNTQTISVIVNPLPVLNVSPANPTICFSESIILSASGATTYSWSPTTGLNNTAVANVVANPSSTQIYTITGTDANGCSNTISTSLIVNPLPVLSITPTNPAICIGDAVNVSCNGASTYLWSPAAGLNTTVGNNVQANPTNTTTNQIIGTSNQGCKDSITNTVTVNPLPILTVSPISNTICQGQTTTLTVSGATIYAWTPGGSLNTASGTTVQATPYLTTTYTIVGTDINTCTSTKQITVNVNPSYTKYDTLELCDGMSYTFGNQTITTAGNYMYTFQTTMSCDSIVNLHVIVYDKPIAGFTIDHDVCVGDAITIQNNWQSSQATYNWNVGDGILTSNTPSINVIWTIPGTKTVSLNVSTQSPCVPALYQDTVNVHQADAKIIVSDLDTLFCTYDQVKLQTTYYNGYTYLWSPSSNFNSSTFKVEGIVKEPVTVRVNVKDAWGCEAEDSKYLNVQPCCNAYLPSSFTPNGDGLNDVFRIIGEGNYHILDFYVANRWGNIIFRTIDQNTGWDGKIKGVEQSMDTYYYFLRYECANGEKRFIKGDLTLLR